MKSIQYKNSSATILIQLGSSKVDFSNVTITNVFGDESTESTVDGILTLDVDDTPLYIEEMA